LRLHIEDPVTTASELQRHVLLVGPVRVVPVCSGNKEDVGALRHRLVLSRMSSGTGNKLFEASRNDLINEVGLNMEARRRSKALG